jgi:hypothetical protein
VPGPLRIFKFTIVEQRAAGVGERAAVAVDAGGEFFVGLAVAGSKAGLRVGVADEDGVPFSLISFGMVVGTWLNPLLPEFKLQAVATIKMTNRLPHNLYRLFITNLLPIGN